MSYMTFSEAVGPLLSQEEPIYEYYSHKDRRSAKFNPAVEHATVMLKTCRKFGMTPASRGITEKISSPSVIDEMRGNPREKFIPQDAIAELDWDEEDMLPPAWLDYLALEYWGRVVPTLMSLKLFTPLDVAAFAAHCAFFSLALKAHVDMPSVDVEHDKTAERSEHPSSEVQHRSISVSLRFWKEFGLTPKDRRAFVAPYVQDEESLAIFL
jgi:P27 family predicted phage terminase small subunit